MGCDRDKSVILPHTELIFPDTEGLSRISYVEDTTFTTAGINAPQVVTYFKQEVLGGIEEDLSGRRIRRIDVFQSPAPADSSYDFVYDRLWTHHFEPLADGDYYAERTEQNKRVRVLKFPVYEGVRWNGNLFNNDDPLLFEYQNVDTTVVIRGKTYENCVMVIQEVDTSGIIFDRFAYEIYAPNIGLVKKYSRSLVFDGPPPDTFNPADSYIYYEEIVEHNAE